MLRESVPRYAFRSEWTFIASMKGEAVGGLGIEFCVVVIMFFGPSVVFVVIIIIVTNGLPQPRMELAERSHEQTYLGWYC